jgi:hypothetical protein
MSDLPAKQKTDHGTKPAKNPIAEQEVITGTADDEKPTREARKHRRYRKLRNAPNWIQTICGIALVGITWAYTHYAGQQLGIMKGTLNLDRPWVGITGSGNFKLEMAEGAPLSVSMGAQNVGRTPALNLVSVSKLTIVGLGGHTPDFGGYSKSEAGPPLVLFPGSITTIQIDTIKPSAGGFSFPHLKPEEVEALKSGTAQIYVYGSIWYDDTLHTREHRTDYCFVYVPLPDTSKPITPNFGACNTHNYAD